MTISRTDAAHLLRRSGFSARPADITRLAGSADWAAAVDTVLDTSAWAPTPIPAVLLDPAVDSYQQWVHAVQWWIDRMRTTPCPIVEKLALYFHGFHFVSSIAKAGDAPMVWNQIELFRAHALGDFHALAQAVAIDPWMLLYLDNADNRAPHRINENFGREVLELFTLGNGAFTEADVVAMSRAWTGHNLTSDRTAYRFDAAVHDNGTKTLFGISRNWNGPDALTEVLKGTTAVASSRYVAAKLWSYLAAPNPAPVVVDALAAEFRSSNLSLRALVRAIFLHPEFRTTATRTALVRSPVEWFVAVTAALGIPASESHPEWWLEAMGQRLYDPPNVAGWRQNGAWLTSAYWWRRSDCAGYLRWVATDERRPYRWGADLPSNAAPRAVADRLFDTFGVVDPTPRTRASIEGWAAGVSGTWHGWSLRSNGIVLAALSPDVVVG